MLKGILARDGLNEVTIAKTPSNLTCAKDQLSAPYELERKVRAKQN